ncbi:histidinol-phosphate aminotransferase [Formosa sp. Hel3_A1_48]|jgi:histidinol-phosphate aminotransferase|uniref:histidinol-phosphate transaminase n=1 Tax=Formosa sp. Hel3_A1_48 TaxID=1336795 RepID=UPI00084E0CEF|nr:histidinol-phosphate transaminase [Formosa sp. Hel3_A1_48]AOR27031.1 histidinol-phosphate aminotransferase [Formosa sp. Hel3_A1_48]MDC0949817.1 histidinol-phosphate transaminase [Flavobacteriaceae bacterium]
MNLNKLIRPAVKAMKSYSSARDEFESQDKDLVFLDANENPFPNGLNRYPDPQQMQLKNKLAALKGLRPSQILCGNGSDEVLDLIFRAFCEPNEDGIITLTPTYGMYAVLANLNGIQQQCVSLTADFQIDVPAVLNAIRPNSKLLFICSPNNPSGNVMSRTAIKEILKAFKGLVVIDEAYIDFTDTESWLEDLSEHPNLVVTQTLSKAYGLAGIRLGICYATEEIIAVLNKIKPPYNINSLTQKAAISAISQRENTKQQLKTILDQRTKLIREFKKIAWIEKLYPTDANFILIRVDNANLRYEQLKNKGIIVRNRTREDGCTNCLRITVGTAEENKRLINTLNTL